MNNRAFVVVIMENLVNEEEVNAPDQIPRQVFPSYNAFQASEFQFMKNFRLPKRLTLELIETLRPYITDNTRESAITVEIKVLSALSFYGTGSYQTPVGRNIYTSLSQPSISRCLKEVTGALIRPEIFNQWVHFPSNQEELDDLRQSFHNKFGMPGVIGCIDCTHVAIVPPPKNDPLQPEHIFVNRKGYHSLNVLLICGTNLKIIHVNARFPLSTHDAHIWNSCSVEPTMRNIVDRNGEGYFLLGDSGYPLRSWLLTPLQNPEGAAEENYNLRHKSIRSIIERCNGLLKARFRCLLKHRVLHYSPNTASNIVNACIVLHNMCVENNVQVAVDDLDELNLDFGNIDQPVYVENIGRINPELVEGRRVQRRIINHLNQR